MGRLLLADVGSSAHPIGSQPQQPRQDGSRKLRILALGLLDFPIAVRTMAENAGMTAQVAGQSETLALQTLDAVRDTNEQVEAINTAMANFLSTLRAAS